MTPACLSKQEYEHEGKCGEKWVRAATIPSSVTLEENDCLIHSNLPDYILLLLQLNFNSNTISLCPSEFHSLIL
jgi:hypothetical protein